MCNDCGYGSITVSVDGKTIGTLNSYLISCSPSNNAKNGVVRTDLIEGEHTYEAYGKTGGHWYGTFTIKKTRPTKIKFDCSGVKTTNSGGYSMPSNYNNQGNITVKSQNLNVCVRDWDAIDGDIIDIIINGYTMATSIQLTGSNKCWNVSNLTKGNNWIGIICKSPGTTSAASPRIEINDGISTQAFQILSYPNNPGGYIIKF